MFGVLFGEDTENMPLGVLLFKSERKAKEAFTSLVEKSNRFNNQLFESWTLKLCAIFNSIDIDEVPEIEMEQIQENTIDYKDFDGKWSKVQIINVNRVICI